METTSPSPLVSARRSADPYPHAGVRENLAKLIARMESAKAEFAKRTAPAKSGRKGVRHA